jgi:hypothetical protein
VVRTEAGNFALPNAEVIESDNGVRHFTSQAGEVRLNVPADRQVNLRVRQIGFAFADFKVQPRAGDDTLTVHLKRIAFALPRVVTITRRECPTLASDVDALGYWALDALREGAERYVSFRTSFPFRVEFDRTSYFKPEGNEPQRGVRSAETTDGEKWGEAYKPGGVVTDRPMGFSILFLFLQHMAQPVFWEQHCVTNAAVEDGRSSRVVRLSFEPTKLVKESDWSGDVLIDSSTSVLRRIEFRLRVSPRDKVAPPRFEAYTTFRYPSPFIAIPDSTVSMWWRSPANKDGDWGLPDVTQALAVTKLTYRRAAPPKPER